MKKFFLFFSILFALLFCQKRTPSLKPGQTAPGFELPDLNGGTLDLNRLRGKKIMLHFWADWCSECRAEFPKLQKAHLAPENRDLQIICINTGQSREHIQSFVDYFKLTFPMLLDSTTEVSKLYHINGLPSTVLINSDLTIYKTHIGWLDATLISQLKEHLK